MFSSAKNKIQLIDPYINGVLFTLIQELDNKVKIQVITDKFQGDSLTQYKAIKKERGNIDIIRSKKSHDRYLIVDDSKVYLLGCSLNSIGNKASTIVPIEHDYVRQQITDYFILLWSEESIISS